MERQLSTSFPTNPSPLSAAMATSPTNPPSGPKRRFWKFRSAPKPAPRRRRHTSDSALNEPPLHPQYSPATLPIHGIVAGAAMATSTIMTQNFTTGEMTLSDFARQFQNCLPQQVVVTYGVYCRDNLEVDISSSERLNIHFIRHRESVKIKELDSDVEYSIPVASTLKFGPVYNPYQGNVRDALRGFVYPTVTDLLNILESGPLPKLISATSDSSITTPGDCVSKGEVLLIKEVRSSTRLGYRQLQVHSLTTNTDKFLHENCAGNFTTKPESNKLSLFSIIKHIPNALPLSVKIFPGPNLDLGDQHYPIHLFEKVIKLCCTFTDVLLVASSVPENSVCDGREPFEIPQEVELELRVVKLKDSDYKQLQDKSKQIMCRIQGEYIKQYRNAHQNQASYVVQEMFLKAVSGTDRESTTDEDLPETDSVDELDYPNIKPFQEGLLSRLTKLEDRVWQLKKSQADIIRKRSDDEKGRLETIAIMKSQQTQFQEQLQCMRAEIVALQSEVMEGQRELGHQENPVQPHQVALLYLQELLASPETAERNRNIVATLTPVQVLQLVVEIGVEDLQKITKENLSGDILMELNEDELESDLGISKRIHRLKLMKVIDGSTPVTQYLKVPESNSMDTLC